MLSTKTIVKCNFCSAECTEKHVLLQIPVRARIVQGGWGQYDFTFQVCWECWEKKAFAVPDVWSDSASNSFPRTLHDVAKTSL